MGRTEKPEREGFHATNKVFVNATNTVSLDPVTKRKVTICNLFANHQLPISDIGRVLDETYERVVNVLIEQGLILERRRSPRRSVQAERSRSVSGRI